MEKQTYNMVIESKSKSLYFNIKETWKYKDLIMLFVRRTFVAQYKQTVLGPAWAIIQPLLITVVFTLIFGNLAGLGSSGVPNFIFYLSGTIIWTFFAESMRQTANSFIANSKILGKVYFPRLVMPISITISHGIALGIQYVFMMCFLLYYVFTDSGVAPNIYMLLTPLIILQLGMLGLGFGTIISALTTKYRDLAMLVAFGIQLWLFASPVAYDMFGISALNVGGKYYSIYMLNPVTPSINIFRYAYLGIGEIDWTYIGISWIITIIILIVGILLFNKVEKTFMDTV